jgi:hypothetical protein
MNVFNFVFCIPESGHVVGWKHVGDHCEYTLNLTFFWAFDFNIIVYIYILYIFTVYILSILALMTQYNFNRIVLLMRWNM